METTMCITSLFRDKIAFPRITHYIAFCERATLRFLTRRYEDGVNTKIDIAKLLSYLLVGGHRSLCDTDTNTSHTHTTFTGVLVE